MNNDESVGETIAMLQARIARLEECIRTLTYSNYRDGRRFIGFPQNSDVTGVTEALNESEQQSLAAIQVGILRQTKLNILKMERSGLTFNPTEYIDSEANRIEREANET